MLKYEQNKKRKNIFSVTTEYHFLLTISIIQEHFLDGSFINIVLLLDNEKGRLSQIKDNLHEGHIIIKRLYVNDPKTLKHELKSLVRDQYNRLFIFNEFNLINSYLLHYVNNDAIKALGEDGTAIYQQINKSSLPSRILSTFKSYKKSLKLGLNHYRIPFIDEVHGKNLKIQELWLTHPELFDSTNAFFKRKEIIKVSLFNSNETFNRVLNYFGKPNINLVSESVIYIGRQSYGEEYLKMELSFLNELPRKFGKTHLYIKPHPGSSYSQLYKYKSLSNTTIIESLVPAELFIAKMNNSIVTAMDSTSLYFNNLNCYYYIFYKHFQEKGVYPEWREIPFPEHVNIFHNK